MLNNHKMKRLAGAALFALAVFSQTALLADEAVLQAFINTRDTSPTLTLGRTRNDLDQCIAWAEEYGIPLVAIWSNEGCAHCERLERAMTSEAYLAHALESGLIVCAIFNSDGKGSITKSDPGGERNGPGYQWCWGFGNNKIYKSISMFPFVRFYWKKDGQQIVDTLRMGDQVDGNIGTDSTTGTMTDEFGSYATVAGKTSNKAGIYTIEYMRRMFPGYVPVALKSYSGGLFSIQETEGNRLEAEAGTKDVTFELVRAGDAVEVATNNTVELIAPNGTVVQTVAVNWAKGQDSQDISVDVSKVPFISNGQKASLVIKDANGDAQATNHIFYVDAPNSEGNPLWIGERVAEADGSGTPELKFGEWTMDLDVAKAKVAAADGEAYTLVSIGGSLWCPDCANTERNFTSVKDGSQANRLMSWASEKNVALVAIDVPSFSTNSTECASPTLLSRTPYSTTLARAREYPQSGAESSLTNAMSRSGLGYLTRKGVSDDDAQTVLERNYNLVSTDFSQGGFHSAADSRLYRTGVPIFVILDKQGNVKARLTRFASVSPMAADAEKWDDIIKRFDELIAFAKDGSEHSDGGVLEDDFPSESVSGITAAGGSVSGEISHCDFRDIYKLENFDGNAFLAVTATGEDDAEVKLSFVRLGADGKKVTVASETGSLKDGVTLAEAIETAGKLFVEISGSSYDAADFSISNPKAQAFHAYEINSAVILMPGETRSEVYAPEGSSTVSMLVESGSVYRIEGLAEDHGAALRKIAENFYEADLDDEFSYEDMKTATPGGNVIYQVWKPGVVSFAAEKRTVTESVGDVQVEFFRGGGVSGEVNVRVSLDEDATTLYDSDGAARFEFEPVELTWAEGEAGTTNAVISVRDDARFDGPGAVVLKLDVLSSENSDVGTNVVSYTLIVNEDDKQSPGKAAFTAADPFFAKKATVYARESEGATVYAERIEASDGYVSAKVNSSLTAAKIEIDGEATNVISWANHKYDRQAVKVTGIPAGKSAKITLASPTDGLKILTASNAVTIVSVADDAPAFETDAVDATINRYVATSNAYPVVLGNGVDASAVKLTFSKLSGTLPAGLTAKYDAASAGLAVFGIPTAKAGVYTSVYQVTQKVGTKTTPGLTIELKYTLLDPTTAGGEGAVYNEAVAAAKSRTIKDMPVVDAASKRLVGVLQVTIPQTGKASAKFTSSEGVVSFSAKGWDAFGEEGEKSLSAQLTSAKKGYDMSLVANNDGSVSAEIGTPESGETPFAASFGGRAWSKSDSAEALKGSYTVALIGGEIVEDENHAGIAPRGDGYLTLKLNTASAVNSGTVTYAGMMPNGTAISGSAVLSRDPDCDDLALLPIYKRSSTDIVATLVELCEQGVVKANADVDTHWIHTDKNAEASYDIAFTPYGGLYDPSVNLAEECLEGYETTTPVLSFDVSGLSGDTVYGKPQEVAPATVTVGASTLVVARGSASGATLSFNRSTGVVTGTFKLPCKPEIGTARTVTARYQGVVLLGWGAGCGCSPDQEVPVNLPFVNGAFFVDDTVQLGSKSVRVKRGGVVTVDKED